MKIYIANTNFSSFTLLLYCIIVYILVPDVQMKIHLSNFC